MDATGADSAKSPVATDRAQVLSQRVRLNRGLLGSRPATLDLGIMVPHQSTPSN